MSILGKNFRLHLPKRTDNRRGEEGTKLRRQQNTVESNQIIGFTTHFVNSAFFVSVDQRKWIIYRRQFKNSAFKKVSSIWFQLHLTVRFYVHCTAQRVLSDLENQAFLQSNSRLFAHAIPPPLYWQLARPATHRKTKKERLTLPGDVRGGRG